MKSEEQFKVHLVFPSLLSFSQSLIPYIHVLFSFLGDSLLSPAAFSQLPTLSQLTAIHYCATKQ